MMQNMTRFLIKNVEHTQGIQGMFFLSFFFFFQLHANIKYFIYNKVRIGVRELLDHFKKNLQIRHIGLTSNLHLSTILNTISFIWVRNTSFRFFHVQ